MTDIRLPEADAAKCKWCGSPPDPKGLFTVEGTPIFECGTWGYRTADYKCLVRQRDTLRRHLDAVHDALGEARGSDDESPGDVVRKIVGELREAMERLKTAECFRDAFQEMAQKGSEFRNRLLEDITILRRERNEALDRVKKMEDADKLEPLLAACEPFMAEMPRITDHVPDNLPYVHCGVMIGDWRDLAKAYRKAKE